ncbi:hypothetical protein [Archangium violaceum]|uniref:hypothetical protein n=1 Tax=Archangium violaceum TaxID=83451 RepID=UPI0036D8B185
MPTPEAAARENIDAALQSAGWHVQDFARLNLTAGLGVAVREFPLAPGHGKADYVPENRHQRKATWSQKKAPEGRWRSYGYEELLQRGKVSLDIFWLKDESLEDSANLPAPDVIAGEIVDDLRAALEQFEAIQTDLSRRGGAPRD